jgi:hypothetical protein
MSATINFRNFVAVATETDDQVKQDINGTASALSRPDDAKAVRLTFEKNANSAGDSSPIARFYRHGIDPTASEGIPIYDGMTLDVLSLTEIINMKFISTDANTQTVYCQWINSF